MINMVGDNTSCKMEFAMMLISSGMNHMFIQDTMDVMKIPANMLELHIRLIRPIT